MKITKATLKALKPCADRYKNYVKHYGDKELTQAQFMGLKHISQADKVWVAFRSMPRKNIPLAAADMAESVLYVFEEEYPGDDRPRKAIEAARGGDNDKAYSAARAAAQAAYTAAVNATYAAAVNTAFASADAASFASADAANCAANAAATDAANCAANAAVNATYAAPDREKQEKLIRKICLKYWRDEK